MNQRNEDEKMLVELLEHVHELSGAEADAFGDMRARGYPLSERQRAWLVSVYERVIPQYENLASSGTLARGIATPESKKLDEMLSKPKPLKPPPRRRDDDD